MPQFVIDLTNTVFSLWRQFNWLPKWAVISIIVVAFTFAGWLANYVVFAALRFIARKRDRFWQRALERARLQLGLLVMIFAMALAVTVSPLSVEMSIVARRVLLVAFLLGLGWSLATLVDAGAQVQLKRYDTEDDANTHARKRVTQTRILRRVLQVLILLVFLGLALLTIPGVRQWGLSLLASAGVVGIVAGLALQPFLANLIAGIQIATAQPIRIDDAVVVEGEWGRVEEITSTYVVVKLWDWRRIVLPLTYFIQKPFENWTRMDTRLLAPAFLWVDYEAPIDRLRTKLEEVVHQSIHWDGDTVSLVVFDITERTAKIRCLASARNATEAFDLKCEIREKMLAFMRDECPEALPRDRVDLVQIEPPPKSTRGHYLGEGEI
ncbi:mechanosensitive ion channel domain-containing protein [Brevundimonas sp.]|uniref:mechanosensitive ion channel family protein n=1 Tax=Brevundimonas sp. TaxID=1871086 RepID=UPI00289F7547|nr:mechanosensitive ion channel domain-containing protein [Brevundimonas sp.]